MTVSLWSIFVVNIGINSLLSFFTLSLLICIFLRLLHIRNARVQASCLLIPFIKLIIDLASYQFSHWALAQQLNPLTCPEGTRLLNVSIIPFLTYPLCSIDFHLQQGQTFTVADLLCLTMGPEWTLSCALMLIGGMMVFLGRAFWQYRLSRQWLKKLQHSSQLYQPLIQDSFLRSQIECKRVSLYLSDIPHSPCIVGLYRPSIFLPRTLVDQLTTQELESILAHEMAHLRQGDLLVNAYLFWISPFFWWILTRYFKRKLELAQECACDRLLHTNIPHESLAQALYKTARWLRSSQLSSLPQPAATFHHAVERLQILLLLPKSPEPQMLKGIKLILLSIGMIVLLFGKFWTF